MVFEILRLVSFFAALIVPVIFTGPGAAIYFYRTASTKSLDALVRFWFALPAISCLSALLIIINWGHSWPGSGFLAVLAAPIAAVISLVILIAKRTKYLQIVGNEPRWRLHYYTGIFLIPILQVVVAFVSPRFVDPFCRWYPTGLLC